MDFTDLVVWQRAKKVVLLIYRLTKDFPKEEIYGLTSQLRRASSSVCANIAEGFGRYHTKDKIRFYYNARGSVSECMSHLSIAGDLGYISNDNAKNLLSEFETIRKMVNGMVRALGKG
ncbi:MAG: four helix bundle protein [bacterium]|nr:four helix bundle protein [Candidatus Margulisiibacteriota bacterium]